MTILALNGSLRAASANRLVLARVAALAGAGGGIVMGPDLGALPHFNPDLDIDPEPPNVAMLRTRIAAAEAVLICTPEYTFSIPGALRNALDWLVSSGSLYEKRAAVIATSTSGGAKVLAGLCDVLAAHQAKVAAAVSLHPADARAAFADATAPPGPADTPLLSVLAALRG